MKDARQIERNEAALTEKALRKAEAARRVEVEQAIARRATRGAEGYLAAAEVPGGGE